MAVCPFFVMLMLPVLSCEHDRILIEYVLILIDSQKLKGINYQLGLVCDAT